MRVDKVSTTFLILGGLLFFIVTIPILNIFTEQILFHFPSFVHSLTEYTVLKAVGVSLFASFLAVLTAFILGVPLAYLLANEDFLGKGIVEGFVDLPMAIPHTAAGVALLVVFGANGLIGAATEPFFHFERSLLGIVVAMTFISTPYMINSAKEGFQSVDRRLENVGRNLGASRWEAFHRISFPLAFPHIFNGAIMAWARSISEFSAIIIFVGYWPTIAPGLIWTRFHSQGLSMAMSIAVVLLAIVLAIFVLLRYLRGYLFDKY